MFDLNSEIKNLYLTNDYFVKRNTQVTSEELYSESNRVDPDGVLRYMESEIERNRRIANLNYLSKNITEILNVNKFNLLDLGCGYSPASCLEGVDNYLGVDVVLSKYYDSYGVNSHKIKREESNIENYIENNNIDFYNVILLYHVIEHLENPFFTIKTVYDKMEKGSLLIIGTPDFDSPIARRYGNKFRFLHDQTHISLFSLDSLKRMVRDIGFSIRHSEFPYFETEYFTQDNLLKVLKDKNEIDNSPPFYGSKMTIFCVK